MRKFLIVLSSLFLWSCGTTGNVENENAAERLPLIVCTTGMLGDAVSHLTSNCEVKTLMGPGTDPHLFKPGKESLDLLESADVIVANGLHLEGRMQDVLVKIGRQKPVIFAGDAIQAHQLTYADGHNEVPDPHIWFDVSLWRKAILGISEKLDEVQNTCHDLPKRNAYLLALDSLHEWVISEIESISESKRVLITAHDAFAYFGQAYGMEVEALQGISTAAEYGVRDVTNMIDFITSRQIAAIFEESSIAPRSIEAVMAGCADRGFDLKLGGTLYTDALGGLNSGAETYVDMMRHNVATIKNALQ